VPPLEETATGLLFKKGVHGLSVSFTQALGRPDRSAVHYSANRIYADVPFPPGATDIVYDERRPYFGCTAPGNTAANLDFFNRELAATGWTALSADDAKTRWPNAAIDDKIDNGARAYFRRDDRDRQLPIMVSLRRLDDDKTAVDIRVAPFALPQDLQAGTDIDGLPRPDRIINAGTTGNATSDHREAHATVTAEMPAVLAFYRRELAARNWKEEAQGAIITPDEVSLNFTSPEETGTLKLGHKHDLTLISFVMQVTPATLAALACAVRQGHANPGAGRRGECRVRWLGRQTRVRITIEREGPCGFLSQRPEATRLEGAAVGDQQSQHGRDAVLQGRQGDFDHHHADGPENQCQRERFWS
jgi:hypothetical protein